MKKLVIYFVLFAFATGLTGQGNPGKDWYQKFLKKDTMGIDLIRAYADLLKDKTYKEIVVAVIDGGTDVLHPDLAENIWKNPGEIPFNNVDDDNNGYVDDTCGWNFIGGMGGECVEFDNLEKTRLLRKLNAEFADMDDSLINSNPDLKARHAKFIHLRDEIETARESYEKNTKLYGKYVKLLDDIRTTTGTDDPDYTQVEKYPVSGGLESYLFNATLQQMKEGKRFSAIYSETDEGYKQLFAFSNYHYNINYDCRKIVGDDYENSEEKLYGNNNVAGPDASHGTHVAGIIAAVRNNNYGMNGVAKHAKIMVVRVVPNGDERDKDVANGIRYAVDNGAKIINMSFGKEFSWNKAIVNAAIVYAVSKNVLLVHASGNDNKDIDIVPNYPNDSLGEGKFAASWIEIGASAPASKKLATDFSNYGKSNVDVFAPGYQIYSTTPDSNFAFFNGTSMAAPVTSGVAALVWSYYPSLTAIQVKDILMRTAVVYKKKVPKPGGGKAKFKNLSVSGGVVNAYNALLLADQIVNQR